MNTVQREARPASAEEAFTARELDAAEQLIHLSESGASSVASGAAASGDSSPRSVNAPAPAPAEAPCADWEEDEEREVAGSQRRVKRYRLIAEIYAATEEIGARGGSSSRRNKTE